MVAHWSERRFSNPTISLTSQSLQIPSQTKYVICFLCWFDGLRTSLIRRPIGKLRTISKKGLLAFNPSFYVPSSWFALLGSYRSTMSYFCTIVINPILINNELFLQNRPFILLRVSNFRMFIVIVPSEIENEIELRVQVIVLSWLDCLEVQADHQDKWYDAAVHRRGQFLFRSQITCVFSQLRNIRRRRSNRLETHSLIQLELEIIYFLQIPSFMQLFKVLQFQKWNRRWWDTHRPMSISVHAWILADYSASVWRRGRMESDSWYQKFRKQTYKLPDCCFEEIGCENLPVTTPNQMDQRSSVLYLARNGCSAAAISADLVATLGSNAMNSLSVMYFLRDAKCSPPEFDDFDQAILLVLVEQLCALIRQSPELIPLPRTTV
jgi:hypothetical protein